MTKVNNRVLVIMNRFQGYEISIPEALRANGHEALWSDARPGNGFFVKALTRLGLLQHIKPISRANVRRIIADAVQYQANTLLLISPENLRALEIEQLRAALPNIRIVLYLYDSSANRHLDQRMIDNVDNAYSFDIDDCDFFDDLVFVPLFHHHEAFSAPTASETDHDYDFCFIGTGRVRRLKVLAGIARKARQNGKRCFFYLYAPSFSQYALFYFYAKLHQFDGTLSRQSVPFETYLDTLARSACVIDIEQQNQGGLTIRTMDAVFAGRPFATSNENIERHDFYPHFPISVFSTETLEVQVPSVGDTVRAEHFFHKYHVGNWLETILSGNIQSYRKHDPQPALSDKEKALSERSLRE